MKLHDNTLASPHAHSTHGWKCCIPTQRPLRYGVLCWTILFLSNTLHASTPQHDPMYYHVHTQPLALQDTTPPRNVEMFIQTTTPLSQVRQYVQDHNVPPTMYFLVPVYEGMEEYYFGLPPPVPDQDPSFHQYLTEDLVFKPSDSNPMIYHGKVGAAGQGYRTQSFQQDPSDNIPLTVQMTRQVYKYNPSQTPMFAVLTQDARNRTQACLITPKDDNETQKPSTDTHPATLTNDGRDHDTPHPPTSPDRATPHEGHPTTQADLSRVNTPKASDHHPNSHQQHPPTPPEVLPYVIMVCGLTTLLALVHQRKTKPSSSSTKVNEDTRTRTR